MHQYQKNFIKFALANGALLFGDFTLKSGRKSPYFFNAGMFKDGEAFHQLGLFYAEAIKQNFKTTEYDLLFGPAYKGITLVTTASIAFATQHKINIPVCYNRKEAKDHGEGGVIVGESPKGKKVILLDDVITAGTTIRDSVEIMQATGGKLIGVVIALDRQEKGLQSNLSAIQEIEKKYNLKVASIVTLDNVIAYLREENNSQSQMYLEKMLEYRTQHAAVQV